MGYGNEHTLQDLLKRAYHRLDMDDVAMEMDVKRAYSKVVGDFINRLTWTVKFEKGTLILELASAALKQELFNRRSSLAESINKTLGHNAVKTIIIK